MFVYCSLSDDAGLTVTVSGWTVDKGILTKDIAILIAKSGHENGLLLSLSSEPLYLRYDHVSAIAYTPTYSTRQVQARQPR